MSEGAEQKTRWDTRAEVGDHRIALWDAPVYPVGTSRRARWDTLGPGEVPASRGGAATVVFAGSPVQWTERSSLSVDTAIGERSTARFTIVDKPGTLEVLKGEQVRVYHMDGGLIFGGYTETAALRTVSPGTPSLTHSVHAKDWHYLADKHRVVRGFQGMLAGDIIRYMVETYLAAEGITILEAEHGESVYPGVEIEEFVVNYGRVSEAIDELASRSDYWWNIDVNRVLWFHPRGTRVAPWELTSADIHYSGTNSTEVQSSNPEYRNRQVILGGIELTDRQTTIRTGNGIRDIFVMPYAVSRAPTVESSTDGGQTWTMETVAHEGTEEATAARWNWTRGEQEIVTRFSPPGTGVLMRFRYIGEYPLVVVREDEAEIEARAAREGGTGVVENMEVVQYAPSRQAARDIADARLTQFAAMGKTLTFQTIRAGLEPGQVLNVYLPERKLNGTEMLITRVNYQFTGRQAWYGVTAVDGPVVSEWKTLGSMLKEPQPVGERVTVGESAAMLVVRKRFEEYWAEGLPAGAQVYPSPDLYPSPTLYPSLGKDTWITQMAWERDGVEFGRRVVTKVLSIEDRIETTVFLGHDVANIPITALVWYGGANGKIFIAREEWVYEKNELEALQIDRVDLTE